MVMKMKIGLSVFVLCGVVWATAVVDSNDLMGGKGLFLTSSVTDYGLDHDHTTSFILSNGSNVLRLEKPTGQQVSYEKGLTYTFSRTQIIHIQFKFASSNLQVEDSNLRITDQNDKTLVLFRAGRSGLIRVNQKQMISFYNESVSTDHNIKLTQIDLIMDWEAKIIEVFINNKFKDKCNFFQESVGPASKVLLYNLYPSVSYWSDIVICQQRCYDFNYECLSTLLPFLLMTIVAIIQ